MTTVEKTVNKSRYYATQIDESLWRVMGPGKHFLGNMSASSLEEAREKLRVIARRREAAKLVSEQGRIGDDDTRQYH